MSIKDIERSSQFERSDTKDRQIMESLARTPAIPDQYQQLTTFIDCLHNEESLFEIRLIDPRQKLEPFAVFVTRPEITPMLNKYMNGLNYCGYSIYLGINPRLKTGSGRGDNVKHGRVVFADFDHVDEYQFHQMLSDAKLPIPTMSVFSGHGYHAYWVLDETITDMRLWTRIQRGIALQAGSDPKVCDPARIMRVPGFRNTKYADGKVCRIVSIDPKRIYSHDEFPLALEAPIGNPGAATPSRQTSNTDAPFVSQDTRASRSSAASVTLPMAERMRRASVYVKRIPGAISGQHGDAATYRVALLLAIDFALDEASAMEVLREWNKTCSPMWRESELRVKIRNALRYAGGQRGSKLVGVAA